MQKYLLGMMCLTLFSTLIPHPIEQPIEKNLATEMKDLHDLQEFIQSMPFVQLIQSFISIFQKTLIACSQLTFDASLTDDAQGISPQDIMSIIEQNPTIKEEIVCLLKRHSHLFIVSRSPWHQTAIEKADKEDVQKILMSFVNIIQCFFKIIQNPENKENIINELLGMLANILQAGKVIMKKNVILLEEDAENIEHHASTKNILTIFSAINGVKAIESH